MSKQTLIVKNRPKDMKLWQDCQWRRQACGEDSCPICGRIKRDRKAHIAKGEDPDIMESVIADVSKNFKEMMDMLNSDARKYEIDLKASGDSELLEPPIPTDYPVYNQLVEWRQGIYDIAEESDATSEAWLYTEAGKDLMWYSSTLMVKIYRQLRTVWRIEEENDEFLDLEYNYTGYVLGEVLDILDKALLELSTNGGAHAGKFTIARLSFDAIKQEIAKQ